MMLFPSIPLMTAFLATSLALAVTPGPGVTYIVTRSLAHGRRAGMASVAGIALGNLANALAAALGLAAWFAASSLAYDIVRYAGAAYLIYLGMQALRACAVASEARPIERHHFRDGLIVSLLNPKTAIFFVAFLPQFMGGPDAPNAVARGAALGTTFVLIAAVTDSLYALAAGSASAWTSGRSIAITRWGQRVSGCVYLLLGVWAALTRGPRATSTR
ncbi:MAG: LysE family translocator [Tepidisphaeraceae bacterium]